MIQRFRKPIVSTSANISGEPSPKNFNGVSDAIIEGVDYVVDWEQTDMAEKKPSTIMRIEPDGRFELIRR